MSAKTPYTKAITIAVVGSVIVVAFSLVLWNNWAKNRWVAKRFAVVEPGLIYRSGQISRHLIEDVLKEHKIETIVFLSEDKDLTQGVDRPDVKAERDIAAKLGIERYNCPLAGDGTGDIAEYANAVEKMVEAVNQKKAVLVHCHAGSQRTGATIAFYRLLVQNRDPKEVLVELEEYEHDPSDNPKLLPYVNSHIDDLAILLKKRGVIARLPDRYPQLAFVP